MDVEVHIHSRLPNAQGKVTITALDTDKIDYLISAFCTEKNIQHRNEFVLQNITDDILPNVRMLSSCNVSNGDVLYLVLRKPWSGPRCNCNQWWILAAIALLIGAVGLVTITLTETEKVTVFDYGVVLDAGSSHTKLFVYRWDGSKINGTAVAHQIYAVGCQPQGGGISNYTDDPVRAGQSLTTCLTHAQSHVPVAHHSSTPIWLGATAGMRLLRASDNKTCSEILESVRGEMKKTPFNFSSPASQARILDGWEEGVYSWITANYLTGNFGQFHAAVQPSGLRTPSRMTDGTMDMGGASTQMTFEALLSGNAVLPNDTSRLRLYGHNYRVYTHSYLCYGLNEAFRMYRAHLVKSFESAIVNDPCLPKGDSDILTYSEIFEVPCTMALARNVTKRKSYRFVGVGDVGACLNAVSKMFDFSCKGQNQSCSFNDVYQPALRGDFIAFSGFYYLAKQLAGTGTTNISLSQFRLAANLSCENSTVYRVSDGLQDDGIENINSGVCFKSQYVLTLLTNGYGFNESNWQDIHFQNSVMTTDLGWTLGLMLNASNAIPAELPSASISVTVYVLLLLLFIAFIMLSLGFACYARRVKTEAAIPHRRLSTYGAV